MVDEDEIKKVFSKNLMHYLISSSKKQIDLANYLNVSATTINNWIKGYKMPRMDKIDKICTFFSIRRTDLIEDKTDKPSSPAKGIRIPVLGRVAAGIPIEAITDIEDWEEIPPKMAAGGEYFALRIKGASMEPKLLEGDIVIVRKQNDVDNGDTAIVLVNGEEATVKQIKKTDTGIILVGLNVEVYQPHFYTNEEIEELPIQIIGKVVESRHAW